MKQFSVFLIGFAFTVSAFADRPLELVIKEYQRALQSNRYIVRTVDHVEYTVRCQDHFYWGQMMIFDLHYFRKKRKIDFPTKWVTYMGEQDCEAALKMSLKNLVQSPGEVVVKITNDNDKNIQSIETIRLTPKERQDLKQEQMNHQLQEIGKID